MKRDRLSFFLFLFLTALSGFSCKERTERVAIIPLGEVDSRYLDEARNAIEDFYGFRVDLLDRHELPQSSLYKPKNRYGSSQIVHWLKELYLQKYDKVLGITEKDIYHPRRNRPYRRVIGLGLVGGRAALVSLYRYLNDSSGGEARRFERIRKTVVHEIGHTCGLHHCEKSEYCIMRKSNARLELIDQKELSFCDECQNLIIEDGKFMISDPVQTEYSENRLLRERAGGEE